MILCSFSCHKLLDSPEGFDEVPRDPLDLRTPWAEPCVDSLSLPRTASRVGPDLNSSHEQPVPGTVMPHPWSCQGCSTLSSLPRWALAQLAWILHLLSSCSHFFDDDLCVPLIGFIRDAFFGPSQRPVEDLDLILHARLWSEVMRLDLVLLLHSSLHPLQACREVVAVHRQFQLPVHVLEIARTGQPSLEAALHQKRRVLLCPVLRGISGSVQAQVESCDLALITRLEVLDGNLYVDWPCALA